MKFCDVLSDSKRSDDLSATSAKSDKNDHRSDRLSVAVTCAVKELPAALGRRPISPSSSPDHDVDVVSVSATTLVSPPYQTEVVVPAVGSPLSGLDCPSSVDVASPAETSSGLRHPDLPSFDDLCLQADTDNCRKVFTARYYTN